MFRNKIVQTGALDDATMAELRERRSKTSSKQLEKTAARTADTRSFRKVTDASGSGDMAKARAIVKRLKAVKNIRKITRTMELIATARFKRAMDRASQAAAYTRKISEIVADLSQASLQISHPLLGGPARTEGHDPARC